jgi:peptide subunit release factor 1 (eRF1)
MVDAGKFLLVLFFDGAVDRFVVREDFDLNKRRLRCFELEFCGKKIFARFLFEKANIKDIEEG